ncbi:hypothetical protein ACFYY2_02990 [Streptomyces sp. NPDC001822]|uniref:hypothetical protein n=1 Tax=Streptomyces sp. NPDC001822 TaxID=3364614 RepID=UPI0036BD3013
MSVRGRSYRYVGPVDLVAAVRPGSGGHRITSAAGFADWDADSWPAVARALERAGLGGPPGFTRDMVFRRCPGCQEHNIVREDDFVCVFCGSELPEAWNVDPGTGT